MIATTLEAIKKALDLRFEQDSNLYINKDQTEEIKKYLKWISTKSSRFSKRTWKYDSCKGNIKK